MKTKHIIFVAVVRVLQAVLIQTFFQPDEYFQSLEVAHHAVFGYGHLTWEWSTSNPIRSILFPSLWIPVYWLLKISGLDETNALIVCPKILQGFFCGHHRCVRLSSLSSPIRSRIHILDTTRQLDLLFPWPCPCSDAVQLA